MNNDIVPELLDQIQREFNQNFNESKKIMMIQSKIDKGIATYIDAHEYAVEVGEILAKAYKKFILVDVLPEGRMYFNIAERILNPTLGNNYDLVSVATLKIQELLNANSGIGLKGVRVPLSQDKIFGFINRISNEQSFEDIAWILDEPVITFTQNVVDEMIKENVDFHAKAGLNPIIIRRAHAGACKWCRNLAGTYNYSEVKNTGNDVYRRHDNCRCTTEYDPRKTKNQDVWSKSWVDPEEQAKIEMRKAYGL